MMYIYGVYDYLRENVTKHVNLLLIAIGVVVCSACLIPMTVMANDRTEREKVIVSVEIQEGDTLWSIATDYMTDEYKSVKHYVQEIKRTNHLTSDTIHEGRYLVVPYYRTIEQ